MIFVRRPEVGDLVKPIIHLVETYNSNTLWNLKKKIFFLFYRVGHAIHVCPSDGAAIGLFPAGGFPKQKKNLNLKTKFNEFP